MKFIVEQVAKGGGRVGRLSGLRSQPDQSHHTPMTLLATQGGSGPHLTQDVLHMVAPKNIPISVPAQHFVEHMKTLQAYQKGVANFASLKSHGVCVTVQDAAKKTPNGYNHKQGVSTWATGGRNLLSPEKYMELVEAMLPDWYEALNDADTEADSSKKRVQKSVTHSTYFVDQCIVHHEKSKVLNGCSLFSPLLGGHSVRERKSWAEAVKEKVVEGFSLLGLHTNGPDVAALLPPVALVQASLNPVPKDKPVQAFGAWNPLAVLTLVECGIDIFDSTFPYIITERNGALVFPNKIESESSLKHQAKKLRVGEEEGGAVGSSEKEEKNAVSNGKCIERFRFDICLKDKSNFSIQAPILEDCTCYTCRTFSRSYIHHLVNVNELLGPVLLMIHNLHHWLEFFESVRQAIRTERLSELKSKIESTILECVVN